MKDSKLMSKFQICLSGFRTMKLTAVALVFAALSFPSSAMAQSFSCAVSQGTPYCQYTGKLSRVYINDDNLMLLYLESNIDLSVVSASGYGGVSGNYAAAYLTSTNPSFSEYLYSTALTALAGDKTVSIQMRGTQSGLLKIDRIWIYK
ncbi:MAG: hypothetical protein ABJN65_00965 [Parasphingorhabdus sp.]